MNHKQLAQQIRSKVGSRFFGVQFYKRSDGSLRTMSCRLGVYPPTKPKKARQTHYNPLDYDLMTVWCRDAKDYRSIPLEGIVSLTIDGQKLEL